jgi:Nucleotidyl transferase AbiEii toxin, Type IV TA system
MVTGGVASVVYGEPRFTRDIDLVIALEPRDARRFSAIWPAAEFYVPPVEVIEEEARRPAHGHFNVSHHETAMRADIYLPGDDPLTAWAMAHTVARRVDEDEVRVAPMEAVILSKLRYYKEGKSDRHLRDIHRMLAVSGDLLHRADLDRWVSRLGLERTWQAAQEFQEE